MSHAISDVVTHVIHNKLVQFHLESNEIKARFQFVNELFFMRLVFPVSYTIFVRCGLMLYDLIDDFFLLF